MSLQGTLDTLSVAEVLTLLESGKKSGVLAVRGDSGESQIAIIDGALVDGVAPGLPAEARSDQEREAQLIDVCFEMIRQRDGEFIFHEGEVSVSEGQKSFKVDEIVKPATDAASEWLTLSSVVTDMLAPLSVQPQLASDSVSIDRDSWAVLMRINNRRSVTDLATELALSRISTARLVRPLLEQGIVTQGVRSEEDTAELERQSATSLAELSIDEPAEEGGSDRGAILRMFSSLRES